MVLSANSEVSTMDERKKRILQAIVRSYIATAEPVGSRTIARVYDLGVSSATIRNEMQDLELVGFLEQPHTSAGRIPSLKGYRFYVDSLMSPDKLSENEKQMILEWLQSHAGTENKIFTETTKILSTLTHNLSLAIQSPTENDSFNYIRFLPLDKERAILLLVSKKGLVDNSIFYIPDGADFPDLTLFAEKINRVLHGMPLNEITDTKIKEMQSEIVADPDVYMRTFNRIQSIVRNSREVFSDGVGELIRQPEFRDMAKIKELIALVEESTKLADLLHTELTSAIHVSIGTENELPTLHEYSVVQAQFFADDNLVGTMAVIGPTRMEYDKVISILHFMQQKINRIIQSG